MSDVVTTVQTATKIAAEAAAKVAKVNAAAGLITGIAALVGAVAALGVKEMVLKAMDNKNSNS